MKILSPSPFAFLFTGAMLILPLAVHAETPAQNRVTKADDESRQAAVTGSAVKTSETVAPGHHFSQTELMGAPLKSTDNETLGTITGIVYSKTGQPLYVTLTPKSDATHPANLLVPVALLIIGNEPGTIYVSLSSKDFWAEPRFRDLKPISRAT